MIVVAVVGSALGLVGLSPKARRMRVKAVFHARAERDAIASVANDEWLHFAARYILNCRPFLFQRVHLGAIQPREEAELVEGMRAEWKRRADYHAAMRHKYERAAMYPWLVVEPDPPEPPEPEL
jgi:hypothetical protein